MATFEVDCTTYCDCIAEAETPSEKCICWSGLECVLITPTSADCITEEDIPSGDTFSWGDGSAVIGCSRCGCVPFAGSSTCSGDGWQVDASGQPYEYCGCDAAGTSVAAYAFEACVDCITPSMNVNIGAAVAVCSPCDFAGNTITCTASCMDPPFNNLFECEENDSPPPILSVCCLQEATVTNICSCFNGINCWDECCQCCGGMQSTCEDGSVATLMMLTEYLKTPAVVTRGKKRIVNLKDYQNQLLAINSIAKMYLSSKNKFKALLDNKSIDKFLEQFSEKSELYEFFYRRFKTDIDKNRQEIEVVGNKMKIPLPNGKSVILGKNATKRILDKKELTPADKKMFKTCGSCAKRKNMLKKRKI